MSSAKQRKSPRVDVELDVTLQTVDGDVPCKTRDASYEGVFIARRDPLPLRKLIRFKTRLPDSDEQLQMLGLVAHTVNASQAEQQGREPGMGIQLFSLGSETRRRWREFLDDLYRDDPQARQTLESSRRPTVRMRLGDESVLEQFRTRDLPRREVFVRTPDLHPEGTEVDLVVSHPVDDATVGLEATVTESVEGSVKDRGLHLKLDLPTDMTDLEQFTGGSIPEPVESTTTDDEQPPAQPAPPDPPPETPETPDTPDSPPAAEADSEPEAGSADPEPEAEIADEAQPEAESADAPQPDAESDDDDAQPEAEPDEQNAQSDSDEDDEENDS